jgi:hypothetical protein
MFSYSIRNSIFIKSEDLFFIKQSFVPGKLVKFINKHALIVKEDNDKFSRTVVEPDTTCLILSVKAKGASVEFELLSESKILIFNTTVDPFQLLQIF